jgi:DNA polymerase-3 subunit gamma/tau
MAEAQESLPYRVLARKYRPVDFTTLVGQDAMVRTLRNAIATGRIAHAFMLTGVRGVGKTTTARIIARALNCIGPDGKGGPTVDPCGVCDHCVSITEDRNVDVIEMDAASRTGVADVRELIEGVRYRPVSARYKVYIIDEVHMLSEKAFNALLKTLEEPPPHVKFVFATTEIRKVPVTVLSRCQRFDLKRVPQDALVEWFGKIAELEKVEISPEALALLARAADGSVRDGLSMLDQAIAHGGGVVDAAQVRDMLGLADRSRVLELFEKTMRGDAPGGRGVARRDARSRRRPGGDPAGPARAHPLGDPAQGRARGRRHSPTASARRARDGAEAVDGLADRAWALLMKGLQETLPRPRRPRGRDGADPAVLRRRPALAVRCAEGAADGGAPAARAAAPRTARRRRWRRCAARARARPQPVAAAAVPRAQPSFTEVVALFESKREARLVNS